MDDSTFTPGAPGWRIRPNMGPVVATKKLKKENEELKEQMDKLAERLAALENK